MTDSGRSMSRRVRRGRLVSHSSDSLRETASALAVVERTRSVKRDAPLADIFKDCKLSPKDCERRTQRLRQSPLSNGSSMTSSSCVNGLAMRRRKATTAGTSPVSCNDLSATKAPMIGVRSSTGARCFDFFIDFLISVKSMSSLENTPLSRDRAEFGVLNPEPEAPTCRKNSSTALLGRPVRSNCRARKRSREDTQRPRLGESAPGAINVNLSRSVCGAS